MTADPGSGSPMSERMQALLSRAVEDQLSEQRQLAGAIAEFRAQVARLAQDLDQLRSAPAESTASLETHVAAVSGEVREAVRLLGERVDGVSRLVQQRGADLADLRALVAQVQASVGEHATVLGGVAGGLAALPSFGDRVGALQDTVTGLNDRLRGLEEVVATVGVVQQRVDGIDASVRELRGAFAGIASRVAELPARGELDAMVARATEPSSSLGGRLATIEAALPSLFERLDQLTGEADRHAQQLSGLHARFDELAAGQQVDDGDVEERLAAVETSIATVRDRVDEMVHTPARDPRVDELMSSIDELHEGLFGDDGLEAQLQAYAAAPATPADDVDERVATAVQAAVADTERRLTDHIDEAVLALAEALLRRRPARVGSVPVLPAPVPAEPPPAPVVPPEPSAYVAEPEPVVAPVPVEPPAADLAAGEAAAGEPVTCDEPAAPEPAAPDTAAYEPPAYEPPAYEPPAYEPPAHEPPAYEPAAYEPSPVDAAAHEPVVDEPAAQWAAPQLEDDTADLAGGRERPEPAPVEATAGRNAHHDGGEDHAGARRRPWWRPGD